MDSSIMKLDTVIHPDTPVHKDYVDLFYSNITEIKYWQFVFDRLWIFILFLYVKIKSAVGLSDMRAGAAVEPPKEIVPSKTDAELFLEKERPAFLKTYQTPDQKMWDENIDTVFYNTEEYKAITMDSQNELEPKWRTRVLVTSTPRGNIIMFYDAFKRGFSYYCDQQGIPYPILNACAMRYVRTYLCRDFFVDEREIPEGSVSRMNELQKEEDRKEKEKMKKANPLVDIDKIKNNASFAKLKNYKLEDKPAAGKAGAAAPKTDGKKPERKVVLQELNTNRFMYLGKTMNYSFIQSIPKKRRQIKVDNHSFSEIFAKENNLQRETMNYKDFKNAWKKKTQPAETDTATAE